MNSSKSLDQGGVSGRSLADVSSALEGARHLDTAQRREQTGAIRTLAKILGLPPEAIPASLHQIQALLNEVPGPARRLSAKTLANVKSRLKAALLLFNGAPIVVPNRTPLAAPWAALYQKVSNSRRFRDGLSRFMRMASHGGVAPDAISDAFLDRVVDSLRHSKWSGSEFRFRRTVVTLWNEAAETVPGWPPVQLTVPEAPSRPSHLPLAAFPPSFTAELEEYLAWLSGARPFAESAPPRICKPITITQRRLQLRLAASALAEASGDAAQVDSLAVLVRPASVERILTRFYEQAGKKEPTAFLRSLAMAILSLARHYLKVKSEDLARLRELNRRLGSSRSGLTSKNRRLLAQFEDPKLLQGILELPAVLAEKARRGRFSNERRVQIMRTAVTIELLLHAAPRLHNLGALEIGRQLNWPTGRQGLLYLVFDEDETKNSEPQMLELPERVKLLVHDYLDKFRPLMDSSNKSKRLFVKPGAAPVTDDALRYGVTKAIQRELGIHMTPHQFRHLAAKIMLDAHPGAHPMVGDFLGHRNLKTTVRFYAGLRARQAGREYHTILERGLQQLRDQG